MAGRPRGWRLRHRRLFGAVLEEAIDLRDSLLGDLAGGVRSVAQRGQASGQDLLSLGPAERLGVGVHELRRLEEHVDSTGLRRAVVEAGALDDALARGRGAAHLTLPRLHFL